MEQHPAAHLLAKTTALCGLTEAEARQRLVQDGANALSESGPHGLVASVLEVMREPMFLLLIAAVCIYLVLGDLHEALMLLFFVIVVVGITLYQSHKTERVLQALRDLSSPRALVLRGARSAASPGVRWCATTSCCWPKATVSRPMGCC